MARRLKNTIAYFIYTSLLHVKGDFIEWEGFICHIHKHQFMMRIQNRQYSQVNKGLIQLEQMGLIVSRGLKKKGWYSFYFPLMERDYNQKLESMKQEELPWKELL